MQSGVFPASEAKGRIHGHVDGILPGKRWDTRIECSRDGVHPPPQAGIFGTAEDGGAYSIVLSFGYEDDEDHGDWIIYTGQGGRATDIDRFARMRGKKNGIQTADQVWTGGNEALRVSAATKKPVRVVRGAPPKIDSTILDRYAPIAGYRYDGLYEVEKAWGARGKRGFKICRFKMRRCSGQPSPPWSKPKTKLDLDSDLSTKPPAAGPSRPPQPANDFNFDVFLSEMLSRPPAGSSRIPTGVSRTSNGTSRLVPGPSRTTLADQRRPPSVSIFRPAARPSVSSPDPSPIATTSNEGQRKLKPPPTRALPKPAAPNVPAVPAWRMSTGQIANRKPDLPRSRSPMTQSARDQLARDIFGSEDSEDSDDDDDDDDDDLDAHDARHTQSDGAVARGKRKRPSWSDREGDYEEGEISNVYDSEPGVEDSGESDEDEGEASPNSDGPNAPPTRDPWASVAGKRRLGGLRFPKRTRVDCD